MNDDDQGCGARPRVPSEAVAGLRLVGWTHRTSPLSVLEQVAVPRARRAALLQRLLDTGHPEAVVLSTCNRTEVYVWRRDGETGDPLQALAGSCGVPPDLLEPGLVRDGEDVATHLFEVTAGLDSRLLGEVEIRGQVRAALRDAETAGAAGPALRRLFSAALRSATRVHQQTGLEAEGRSLGRHAVDLGLAQLGAHPDPFVLVVGAGRMARTAVEDLARRGVHAHVAARDRTQAARLVGGHRVCPLPALHVGVGRADLLICATSASSYVVTAPIVRRAMRTRSAPLSVVDLSVPRNVDRAVADVPGVQLVDLTEMHDGAATDPQFQQLVRTTRELVQEEQRRFLADAGARAAATVITEMRQHVEQLCLAELLRRGPAGVEQAQVRVAARAISGKLLHGPVMAARAAAANGDDALLDLLRGLFDLSATQDGRSVHA